MDRRLHHLNPTGPGYKQAGARIITLDVDNRELHRRAATGRPQLWHRLIDTWQPNPDIPTRTGSRDW